MMERSLSPLKTCSETRSSPKARCELPRITKPLLNLFGNYSDRFLRKHFHSVRILKRAQPAAAAGLPLVIYLNHASWWDPLVCLLLARRFYNRRASYAPVDASALRRYRFFRRLGFFPVTPGVVWGAAEFLDTARLVLAANRTVLWLTPQGDFVDPRARPARFQTGLGHLTKHGPPAAFVPLALEYTFWEERLPEILIGFGAPLIFDSSPHLNAREATQLFEFALTSVQDDLANAAQRRAPDEWETVVRGKSGSSRVYDSWRRARAVFRGEKFSAAHSDL
jgi:1-acyl-sn-glycerol-3-phosphate acyltransferase